MKRVTRSALRALPLYVSAAILIASLSARADSVEQLQPLTPAPSAETGAITNETPKMWFIEYPTAPLAEGTRDADVDNDDKAFHNEASSKGVSYKERLRFKSLWNGISVEAKPSTIAKIRQFTSVRAVHPVQIHSIPRTAQVSPDLATAIQMTGADIAHAELGLTGKGVRVAVMDTGIDYDHPDLGGGFGKHKRVSTGWDFVGDDYDASDPTKLVTHPDPYPDDCNGHGTHVAGIIGANGDVTKGGVIGVAPGVTFGAYRVFGCAGSTSDDIMIAAMERILKDRMDVLNMSIGDAFNNWPGSPTASAADRLVRKGVVVVASIGNSGANGLWSAGAPGVGDRVIGVASFDNLRSTNPAFSVSPDGKLVGYDQAAAAPIAPRSGTMTLARTGTPATANDGCNASSFSGLGGKVVLVRRGTCSFFQKAQNAQSAGAVGMILYNNATGRVSPTVAGIPAITIPVVAITAADGATINDRIAAGATTMTWTTDVVKAEVATASLISSFSSYGLAADLSLKPDIGAPGGFIWSTLPLEQGGHGSLSGTSMSSPHVAGSVALLLQAKGILRSHGNNDDDGNDESWRSGNDDERNISRASLVRDVLQNSAEPQVWWGNRALGFLDNVQRQGAGMLKIDRAVQATSFLYPGKLSLGEGSGAITKRLLLVNLGRATATYTLSHVGALSNGPDIFLPTFSTGFATVTFGAPTLTLRPGETKFVDVTVTPNAGLPDRSIYGGYIVATSNGNEVVRTTYVGFKGDYQSITVMPSIQLANGSKLPTLDKAGPFTMVGDDVPSVFFHLDLQARRLTLEVVDAKTNKTLGEAISIEYMARNSTSTSFFGLTWDGTYLSSRTSTARVTAPNGDYILRLVAEKPLGDKNNAESWESPTSIHVQRP